MTDQERLDQARLAYHKLLTGTAVVEVDTGTDHAKFTPANREALESYIERLEELVIGSSRIRGAIGVVF